MKENGVVLKAEHLKAFYVLRSFGRQVLVKAVNDVNLEIHKGKVFGIAGESGCGKSTLLKGLFAAIVPPLRLFGGRVLYRIEGQDVEVLSLSPEAKRQIKWKFISYVPQGSMSVLNPIAKIKRTFRDVLESHGRNVEEALEMAKKHLNELGLPSKVLHCYPHQLSGGMRQRVTIALATLLQPDVILADEPTTALDVVTQRSVIQLLKDIQEKWGNTLVLVTHDMGVHANMADRIAIMYAGSIVEEATTQEIFGNPCHPYTRYLINSLPRFGEKSMRESVPGNPPSLSALPDGCPFHPRCPHVLRVCREQVPNLINIGNDHKVACWLIGGEHNG
jgi:peptide/nickel transport system ATP-binding protein